jgi:MFS family permease
MDKSDFYFIATAIIQFVVMGTILTLGVLVPIMTTSLKNAAITGSLMLFFLFLGGTVFPSLADRFGPRPVSIAGAVLWFAGTHLFARSDAGDDSIAFLGVMAGIGGSACHWASISQLDRREPLVLGLALAVGSVGQLVPAFLLPHYLVGGNWKDAMLHTTAIGFALLTLSSLLLFKNNDAKKKPRVGVRQIIKDRDGFLFALSGLFFMFGFYAPFVTVIVDAKLVQASYLDASLLVGYMVAGSVLGRLVVVGLSKSIGMLNTHRIFLALAFFTTVAGAASSEYMLLALFSVIYGFFASGLMTTYLMVSADFWGDVGAIAPFLVPGAFASLTIASELTEMSTIHSKAFVSLMYFLALAMIIPVRRRQLVRPDLSHTDLA